MESMQAGRELDALIAEKVMGWTWKKKQHHDCSAHNQAHLLAIDEEVGEQPNGEWSWLKEREEGLVLWSHMPAYSTDIAAAWEVADKIMTTYSLAFWVGNESMEWIAMFGKENYWVFLPEASADTAPLAICLAALKAVDA